MDNYVEADFSQGILKQRKRATPRNLMGPYVEFIPDHEIFKKFHFQKEYIFKRLWHYAYLNTGLCLSFNGELIESKNGLLDLLNAEVT